MDNHGTEKPTESERGMLKNGSSEAIGSSHRRMPCQALLMLPFALYLACAPSHAQDWMAGLSPWTSAGMPTSQSPFPSLPHEYRNRLPTPSDFSAPYRMQRHAPWRSPHSGRYGALSDGTHSDSYQPNLSGIWRGSGGETVEIKRNRARIWGGGEQSCECVFFLVGERLIAYSPASDTVRKYWFLDEQGHDRFNLIDEQGNLLNFTRAR